MMVKNQSVFGVITIGNIKAELRSGVIISAIGKYSNYIIQLGITAILSRILTPGEYGIVAIVNVFLTFFNLLVDMGIGPAIIQNKKLTNEQTNRIYYFTIILSFIVSIIFAFLAKPIAWFYNNPDLFPVSLFMSFVILTTGFNIVPQAVLLKQKRFLDVNVSLIISNLVGGISAVIMALNGFSYYSLVFHSIIRNIVNLIILTVRSGARPARKIYSSDLKEISTFSRNQLLFNVINYFSRNLDNLLIGKFISPQALGFYDKAYQLSLYPNQIFTSVITPVIQPVLSDYEKEKHVIKNTYISISNILALIGMPLTVFFVFSAREIILILFGPQWEGSVQTFQILALSVWIQMILSSTGSIFQSANRTDLLLLSGILSTILNVAGIVTGILLGKIEYVALALVISFFINFLQCNYLLMVKTFASKQAEYYKTFRSPILLALLLLVPLIMLQWLPSDMNIFITLALKAVLSLVMYMIGLKATGTFELVMKTIGVKKRG